MIAIKRAFLRSGFRGGFLLFLSLSYLFHGFFLMVTDHALNSSAPLGGDKTWGLFFILVSAFMLTGVFRKRDLWQFTAAVFIMTLWSLEYFWRSVLLPYEWSTGLMWMLLAVVVTLVSTWPEPLWLEVKRRALAEANRKT